MHAPQGPVPPVTPPPQTGADRDRLFNLSLDMLCIAGLDGYFKQVNPSWTRVLGWSEEELLSRPVSDFMHPEDRERTLQARAGLARGIPVRGLENRYLCKDGSYRWLSWQSSIEPGAATVFAVARDITARRQSDHERLILSKLESAGTLAGGIAHDFNNLLASLMLNLEMIGMTGPVTDRQDRLLRQSLETVQAAQGLTQQLLTFAHGGVSSPRTADLRNLLREALDLSLSGSNVRGESRLAPDLWTASVDEAQISQVMRNLILNAREAMPGGGTVTLCAENATLDTSRGAALPGDYLHISVTDEGAGIPADTLPRIFDPYFSTKQRGSQKGMGLGLTICHAIIQKHGGLIAVDSTPGRGTTVHCHLPALQAPPATPPAVPPPGEPSLSRRILVMDDEPCLREIMAGTLTHIGYSVELAKDGDEALALYEQARNNRNPFAVVLLDLTVRGGMGGSETLRVLRERDASVRAILMTGYTQEKTFQDHARHGFHGALAKPFTVDALRAALAGVLGERR